MVGGLRMVVVSFKFHQNQLSFYQHAMDQKLPYHITLEIWPLAYWLTIIYRP